MNGTNPLVSQNKFDEVDDFNLFSIYDEISEAPQKDFLEFKIVAISTIFHPDYNEILAISLKANNQRTISLIFSQDEISPYENLTSEALDSETRSKLMHYCDVNFAKYDVTLQNVDAILIN